MKKYIIVLVVSLQGIWAFGQNPEIKTELPTIIPPSPTVAALMKFEETPVSNYTGMPNVSIPLFSSGTISKDVNIDLSLKYHPGSNGADERSSDVGLGWSLFAGGTISRTVRGLPDEELVLGDGLGTSTKVGIYQTTVLNHVNNYYSYLNLINTGATLPAETINEFLWESAVKGKYDNEHDLWQFNFMGFSGRFYIKKNMTTGLLEVKPLDDYRIKIINNYTTVNNVSFIPTGFTIYDEKGNRYVFDVIETTNSTTATISSWNNLVPDSDSITSSKIYNSSFHLSKVYDTNNILVVEFVYNPDNTIRETIKNSTITLNDYFKDNETSIQQYIAVYNCFGNFKPFETRSSVFSATSAKKLLRIDVIGKSKIEFVFQQGRLDTNIQLASTASALKEVIIKDWENTSIKKYTLEQAYSHVIDDRMVLKKVKEVNFVNTTTNTHELFYETNDATNNFIGKDYWGYFNLNPLCKIDNLDQVKEPTPRFSTTDILQKIKYPTGGCTIFNYEANQYTFIGNTELTNFDENTDYSLASSSSLSFTNQAVQLLPISTTANKKAKFYPSIMLNADANLDTRSFTLLKQVNGVWATAAGLTCPYSATNTNCCIDFVFEQGVQYGIRRNNLDILYTGTDYMAIDYYSKGSVVKKYLNGAGNRIKQIGYFDKDVPQDYYKFPATYASLYTPSKQKDYNYSMPTDATKSSGSLSFAKPLFQYPDALRVCVQCLQTLVGIDWTINIQVSTTFNNLLAIRTQGADIGYKYVSVSETNNGKTDYIYTSPIDYPEENYSTMGPPFLPTKNFDYKRGLLLTETTSDNTAKKLTQTDYSYGFDSFEEQTGMKVYYNSTEGYVGSNYPSYASYIGFYDLLKTGGGYSQEIPTPCLGGRPINYVFTAPVIEAFGWAKLNVKTTKNYFYTGSTPNIVESTESYTYNTLNKKIASQTTTNSNTSEVLKSDFAYHTGNSAFSQNRISEIEKVDSYRNTDLLSSTKIIYSTTFPGNASQLPQNIQTATTGQPFENRLKYNAYDDYGNPLEVQQEGGVTIAYIWGYNKSQPIAKIENATYASVLSQVANLQTLSNTGTEASLLTALNSLRTSLPNAMVTTYTYKPLIGISTMTDPKGDKMTYEYDEFNRLKQVKDQDGNVLSENQYNYKQ